MYEESKFCAVTDKMQGGDKEFEKKIFSHQKYRKKSC